MDLLEAGIPYLGCCESLGTHKPIIDIYNKGLVPLPRGYKVKYTDPWCMTFVSACAILAGQPKSFPYECSCDKAIKKLKEEGLWVENDAYYPQKNDIIFYHWAHTNEDDCIHVPNHVGIVGYTEKGEIHILEGNYSDSVKWRAIPLNWVKIRGYGKTSVLWETWDVNSQNELIAKQVMAGKWGNGVERKTRLTAAGYDYERVQKIVNDLCKTGKTVSALRDVSTIANEVIKGQWGNNPARRISLTKAGYDYDAVMEIVNNILKGVKI